MAESLPRSCLVRHGETSWRLSGQHTARVDLPRTAHGEANARLRAIAEDVLIFSSAHLLRVPARWLGLDATLGRYRSRDTTAASLLVYQRNLTEAGNDQRHLHDARGIE